MQSNEGVVVWGVDISEALTVVTLDIAFAYIKKKEGKYSKGKF